MIKKVAVINDLSGLGKCSLTAAIPVLSVMGVQACPLPTAILSNQTDYDSYYSVDYTEHIDAHIAEWKKRTLSFDGIYTGYLGSEKQVEKILNFIREFRRKDTLLLVDPVMGDRGEPYDVYTPIYGAQMKALICHADVITPNLTELCLLTETDYHELLGHSEDSDFLDRIAKIAGSLSDLGIPTIIITGIAYKKKLYNLVLDKDSVADVSSEIYGGSYSGTGDLLASVVCAAMLGGKTALESVTLAARFLEASLIDTAAEHIPQNDGVNFEPHLNLLIPNV